MDHFILKIIIHSARKPIIFNEYYKNNNYYLIQNILFNTVSEENNEIGYKTEYSKNRYIGEE